MPSTSPLACAWISARSSSRSTFSALQERARGGRRSPRAAARTRSAPRSASGASAPATSARGPRSATGSRKATLLSSSNILRDHDGWAARYCRRVARKHGGRRAGTRCFRPTGSRRSRRADDAGLRVLPRYRRSRRRLQLPGTGGARSVSTTSFVRRAEEVSLLAEGLRDLGDVVLVFVSVDARGRGSGIPVSGRQALANDCRDGRISRLRAYLDRDEALRVTGSGRLEQLVLAAEDLADGVVDEDPPDRVGQQLGARQHADVLRAVGAHRDRVGDDDLLEPRGPRGSRTRRRRRPRGWRPRSTRAAPSSLTVLAAALSVPAVSIMSSTITAVLPFTSPIT